MKINILYWDNGDKQRLDNTNLSWYYLNLFTDYCKNNGMAVEPFLFDFSEEQVLDEAIHISYEKGSYKRAEKINKVFDYHSSTEDFIGICDSDVIIRPEDYEPMSYFIKTLKNEKFYVFKVDDLMSLKGVDFENKDINFNELELQERNFEPDLGGLFFIHNRTLESIGGFDITFEIYGGEDNRASYMLQDNGYKKILLPLVPIHLLHTNLFTEELRNSKEYQKQLHKVLEHRSKGNYK